MRPAPRAIRCLPPLPVLSSKLPRVSVHVGPLRHGVSRADTHARGEPAPRLAAELKRVLVMPRGLIVQTVSFIVQASRGLIVQTAVRSLIVAKSRSDRSFVALGS